MKPIKPHIFRRYYPKSKRGYWCVSNMPKPYYKYAKGWRKAHDFVNKLNNQPS